jgi:hypothetical protein
MANQHERNNNNRDNSENPSQQSLSVEEQAALAAGTLGYATNESDNHYQPVTTDQLGNKSFNFRPEVVKKLTPEQSALLTWIGTYSLEPLALKLRKEINFNTDSSDHRPGLVIEEYGVSLDAMVNPNLTLFENDKFRILVRVINLPTTMEDKKRGTETKRLALYIEGKQVFDDRNNRLAPKISDVLDLAYIQKVIIESFNIPTVAIVSVDKFVNIGRDIMAEAYREGSVLFNLYKSPNFKSEFIVFDAPLLKSQAGTVAPYKKIFGEGALKLLAKLQTSKINIVDERKNTSNFVASIEDALRALHS